MKTPAINASTRLDSLKNMAEEPLDILVVGGGVTGAGIALDASTRGLRTGIVEAQDWASGTSSRSSKLVHGGLRYLYQLDFKLVAEALQERGLLLETLAPHLVKAQPFLWPLKLPVIERAYSAVGVGMYDALAQVTHRGSVPIQKHYTKSGAMQLFPSLRNDALIGAIRFYDARVDDARLVISLVRTAVQYGALAANRAQVVELLRRGKRIIGAVVEDVESGERYRIRAKRVINSTGVWTEQTQALSGSSGGLQVLASKGVHIVIPKERISGTTGLFLRTEKSVLFIIPWDRYWVIGTTDTKYVEDPRHPVADATDIDYLLDHANAVLASKLTRADIIGTFAGLRPLLQPGTKDSDKTKSTKVSREHTVTEAAPGLVVIAGGKLTTYRTMAQDAVDFALGPKMSKKRPSVTEHTLLVGAEGYHATWNNRGRLAEEYGLSREQIEDLLNRYGSEVYKLLEMISADPTLARPLSAAPEYLRVEPVFACRFEGALHLDDVLMHRIRLNFEKADRGLSATEEIAELMAGEQGWNQARLAREIDLYQERCRAEAEAEEIADEALAQARRSRAPEVAPMHHLAGTPA